jgi:1-pyrroline-5-carboxylate dehydrogenase
MFNLSLPMPKNEWIENFKALDAAWSPFEAALKAFPAMNDYPMIIDGKEVKSDQKATKKDPATGKALYTFQEATVDQAQSAIDSALKAKTAWAALSPLARIQKFRDLEAILVEWKYQTCAITAKECGYTANECSASWAEMIDFVRFNNRYYAELLSESLGDGSQTLETNTLHLRPLKGFTCAVTPFNFPIAIGFHLPLVMALTGNTVVWKPSSDAVLTSLVLMKAIQLAGFPPGVINMITGEGHAFLHHVLKHPQLTCLNFTGSFQTARILGNYLYSTEFQRPNFPRFIAETGGKDFLIADQQIDVVETAKMVIAGAFGRSGQKCSANSVVLLQNKITVPVEIELVKQLKSFKTLPTHLRESDMGPVIHERAFDRIVGYIERAKKDSSCQILAGGNHSKSEGYFISPTVIKVTNPNHELLKDEIFGPVVAIYSYENLEEAAKVIEQHHFRLTGSVLCQDETRLQEIVNRVKDLAGNLYLNRRTTGAMVNQQPFGGDGSSGTNAKAGGKWYLLNFLSLGTQTRQHTRSTTPGLLDLF